MKQKILTSIALIACAWQVKSQTTIAAARAATLGSTVSFRGIVTNGPELGSIRYLQDGTAGIAIYGSNLSSVHRGDSIIASGTLTSYNNLFEVTPATYTVLATNRPLPAPFVVTPSGLGEPREGEIVQINNATFAAGGGIFAGNTNYTVTASAQTTEARCVTTSTLVGTVIPNTPVNITGICSQFCSSPASGCTSGYQLILRDGNDLQNTSSIYITSQPAISNATTSGFNLTWSTNIPGVTSYVKYGQSQNLSSGTTTLAATTTGTSHSVTIPGTPATVYYANVYSINGTDTAQSGVKAFVTKSNSSGTIKTYFNRTTDNSVSSGQNAITLNYTADDTLIAYINRAKSELEIAIYNWDNSSGITTAVNAAAARGVKVRIVYDGSTTQSGLQAISSQCKYVASPQGSNYTIMHNKFVIIDANTGNPNDAILWTGSMNWTSQQLSTDANNIIIFQDQSIARGYKVEFDEMWGDTSCTSSPNASAAKFGQFKKDNTPHEYTIGTKRVEQYFSPSDNTNSHIINTIGTANSDLHSCNMLITRTDLAQKIANQTTANSLAAQVLLDDTSSYTTQFNYIQNGVGVGNVTEDCHTWILHHKYVIIDQSNTSSDPLVLTGSHNWSTAGDTKNDENTVVVHDATIANLYYQEFSQRWAERANCALGVEEIGNSQFGLVVYPNPNNGDFAVRYILGQPEKVTLTVMDYTGRIVDAKQLSGVTGTNTFNYANAGLAKGIYMLQFSSNGQAETKKLIIQ